MKKNLYIIILSVFLTIKVMDVSGEELTFALGSCLHQDEPQPIWNAIQEEKLDGFIFLGDNVYGDSPSYKLEKMARSYNKQKNNFPSWLNEIEILKIWDDHDYGKNDGGGEYQLKEKAQDLFLEFWNIPANDIRHSRNGIYFDLIKKFDDLNIHIIGLDTRYFRSELKTELIGLKKHYKENISNNATVLGQAQWEWLEDLFQQDADLVILLTSIQLLATEHRFEKWSNFPLEKNKLLNMIQSSGKQVVVISGDRHRGGIYKFENLYELTASSMNKPVKGYETDSLLIGKTHPQENYGIISVNSKTAEITLKLKDKKGALLESASIPLKNYK